MIFEVKSPVDLKKIPKEKLPILASDIRNIIIETMKQNGGHLASNLGVVELTIALHYVFNAPDDIIIFDVGHQCYTHKILTGRLDKFHSIRMDNGISGFTRRKESIYDSVDSGHSSTSISQATGFAIAQNLLNKNNHIIVIIGDGALTGGVSYEGLNFSGHLELPLIIILNDNDMSISKNVGAIAKHISKLTLLKPYQKLTNFYYNTKKRKNGLLKEFLEFAKRIEKGLKTFLGMENIFTNLGFEYIGPVDGHNLNELIEVLEKIKNNVKRPIFLHIKTIKGKGYLPAEGNPKDFHGVTPKTMGKYEIDYEQNHKTFTDYFSEKIVEMGDKYKDIVTITAAMEDGTGLTKFKEKFHNRFFDVGIAEQHAVSFASTLGYAGLKPVVAIYSTFLVRALDQIIQDVAISMSPVIFAIDRAGIVGSDGETHQGQFDISYLKFIPNITILAPSDGEDLKNMLEYAYYLNKPVAIRYPKEKSSNKNFNYENFSLNKFPFIYFESPKNEKKYQILIIGIGPIITDILEIINEVDFSVDLIYLRILKPLDMNNLINIIKKYKNLLIIEENVFSGSISDEISSMLLINQIDINFNFINIPDNFIEHGLRKNILDKLGFSKNKIKNKIFEIIKAC